MSEQTPQDETTGYDPATDQDSDPESLNPREGDQATASTPAGTDPDSDPDMLNPRTGGSASDSPPASDG